MWHLLIELLRFLLHNFTVEMANEIGLKIVFLVELKA